MYSFTSTRDIASITHRLHPGDVAVLASGTYGERGRTFAWSASGRPGQPITIKAQLHARVTLLGNNVITGSHVVVQHLAFAGPTGPIQDESGQRHEEYVLGIRGDFVSVSGCEVRDSAWHAGIYITGNHATVSHSWVHDNGVWSDPAHSNVDHGIYFDGGVDGLITANVIDHNVGYGLQVYPSALGVSVTSNVIIRNGTMRSTDHGGGILLGGRVKDVKIAHNVIAFNDGWDLRSGSSYDGVGNVAENNISYGNAAPPWSGASPIAVRANNSSNPCDLILERVALPVVPPVCRPE